MLNSDLSMFNPAPYLHKMILQEKKLAFSAGGAPAVTCHGQLSLARPPCDPGLSLPLQIPQ